MAHVGIALATVLSAWVNSVMLALALRRRGYFAPDGQLKRRLPRMLIASAVMAAALWGLSMLLEPWFVGTGYTRLAALIVLVVSGLAVYGAAVLAIGAADLKEARRLIGR
jgi:putative peptidoglycan lipid II flippase